MSIYEISYNDFVRDHYTNLGKTVKVVKGRKYPIGTEFVIKEFRTDRWGNTYIIAETGEKVARHNCALAEPIEVKTLQVFYSGGSICPHCKAEHTLSFQYDHFDPISDYVYKRHVCRNCTADVDTI